MRHKHSRLLRLKKKSPMSGPRLHNCAKRRYTTLMRYRLYGTLLLGIFTLPCAVSAQSFMNTDAFNVIVNPTNPLPYSSVELTPLSGTVPLANATVRITVDKKTVYEGSAQTTKLPVGGAGVPMTATITVLSNGKTYTKTITVRPQDVSLVLEPLASAPALYAGKPQIPFDGAVRVVAVAALRDAKGVLLDPSKLAYGWAVDDVRIAASSGIGKDATFVASPLPYRTRTVSVTVQSQDGALVGSASATLTAQNPVMRIYEHDPLAGIRFDQALGGTLAIASTEKTLYAVPYSFAVKNGAPTVRWFLNGSSAQTGNTITLRPTGNGAGNASLSAVVSSDTSTVNATQNLSLSFGGTKGILGIFGL